MNLSHRVGKLIFIPAYRGDLRVVGEESDPSSECAGTNEGWDTDGTMRWQQPCLLRSEWWVLRSGDTTLSWWLCPDHAFDAAVEECKRQFFGDTGVNEAEGEAASEGGTAGSGSDTPDYPGVSSTSK